jgi:dsDNA-specific endonuclease/ATPase MutS2
MRELFKEGTCVYTLYVLKGTHPLVSFHYQVLESHERRLQLWLVQMLGRLRARAGVTMAALEEMQASFSEAEALVAELEENAPVPIDVRVSQGTKVVAITGPNMGGKTATIKTVGLAALMAKSGLYILAAEPVLLPWFDAILADIGDEQSLSQSLSTFSGHLQRIKASFVFL